MITLASWTQRAAAAAAPALQQLRLIRTSFSAEGTYRIGGRHDPTDLSINYNPMLAEDINASSEASPAAYEMVVPGVNPVMEPGVGKPGTLLPPEPSAELKAKVPIVKVVTETDVISPPEDASKSPNEPFESRMPRS